MDTVYWPFMAYLGLVFVLVASILGISHFLGERHIERTTPDPFESGIVGTGTARSRLSIKFYLVALFFVIFDVESVFIFAWAIAFREVGWTAYIEVLFFIAVLVAAWVYLWRQGALDWGTTWHQKLERQRRARGEEKGGLGSGPSATERADL
ncbi:MAG: NADH:ubiquinone oxidoreductase subunit A [Candidatus Abyssobacteria bacterium SURF_5]|uniref:NADH-quinone oxidoreductase subunit A n=1 Tax=Abyssobacteria bacterium (strain SURF_5) TaxID=2093360 RepID=A0A3A4N6I2_ABYX5|nr:MAG: NADH:ubiquinone oxidoreductase subunit A [Candidatus Abyssubacteria bacterium SURF_5]